MVQNEGDMAEKKEKTEMLIRIGRLLEEKRKALGKQYRSREQFIDKRSVEVFGGLDWISYRHLCNIEHGKNWISIEKLFILAAALDMEPGELFDEIAEIYRDSPR